jgi:serine phosphatase RsbU (regulator of sigma subunit)
MDIWSGNRSIENEARAPGLQIFVSSQPYRGESRGGDVHYVSVCAGGVLTRLILADVSGHGEAVAETSRNLRAQMRRFINTKRQQSLIHSLNREFTRLEESGRFATAIVASYLSHRNRLTICNAGHPRPLWYRSDSQSWSFVDHDLIETGRASNLPLGLDESTEYQQFDLKVSDGDVLVLYTDALIEAIDHNGQLLGEAGLHKIVAESQSKNVRQLGLGVLDRVREFSSNRPAEDDATLLVLEFSATTKHRPSIAEKLSAYAKVIGIKSV